MTDRATYSSVAMEGQTAVHKPATTDFDAGYVEYCKRDTRRDEKLSGSRLADGTSDSKDRPAMTGWATTEATVSPELTDVSETMPLGAATIARARRGGRDGVLRFPVACAFTMQSDYDFKGRFGDPMGSLAARAAEIDGQCCHGSSTIRRLRRVPRRGPGNAMPSRRQWPVALAIRGLAECDPIAGAFSWRRLTVFCHVAASALDPAWMDAVDPQSDVFIVAQGLLVKSAYRFRLR